MDNHFFQVGKFVELVFFDPEKHAQILSEWYYDFNYRFFFRDFGEIADPEKFKKMHLSLLQSGIVLLMIVKKDTQQPLGLMTYNVEKPSAGVYKYGILLDRSVQGKSFAIDAIIILMDFLFNKKSCRKIVVEFCNEDQQIHRICQAGMYAQEALLKEEIFMDGEYKDEARYFIFNSTFDLYYGDYFDRQLTTTPTKKLGNF